jgi:transcriptional regulator
MYVPSAFEEVRPDVIAAMVADHPLAQLVTMTDAGLVANAVPLLLEIEGEQASLVGHVAKANPLWAQSLLEVECLAIFSGANGYVTPNWYPSKQVDGKAVPTWNYEVVQARGRLEIHHDQEWKRSLVARLTERMESRFTDPWSMDDAPAAYIDSMLRAIVGIEVRVSSISAKRKLSQNRPEQDAASVITHLLADGTEASAALATAMQRP